MTSTQQTDRDTTRRRFGALNNPLLEKELRGRMRRLRTFVVLTAYVLLLSCLASLVYYTAADSMGNGGRLPDLPVLGKAVFATSVLTQLLMVGFITPALTAGAITGERERKTYEVLRTTLLTARKLIWGKLAVALSFMVLLIFASLPLQGLAFMLGGVTLTEFLAGLTMLLAATFFFAVLGLFFSSWLRRTLVSTVLTYAGSLLVTVGLPAFALLLGSIATPVLDNFGTYPLWVQAIGAYLLNFLAGATPLPAALFSEIMLEEQNSLFFYWQSLTRSVPIARMPPPKSMRIPIIAPWIVYTMVSVALGLILLRISIHLVRRQERI
jgi:ABC-type transport system involved in multi-copper enzyme maturation permease subunit